MFPQPSLLPCFGHIQSTPIFFSLEFCRLVSILSHLFICRTIMVWDDTKDELLCRKVLLFEPYQFKPRTRERGNAWKAIAENLGACATVYLKVDSRAVRERLGIITAKYKSKKKEQLAASGISPEQTPLNEALEEIIERMDEAEKIL